MILLAILVVVGAGVFATMHIMGTREGSDRAVEFCFVQETVKAKLQGTTLFPPIEEASFETTEDGKLQVIGKVSVMSSSGRSSRYSYTVVIYKAGGDTWVAASASVVPI